MHDLKTIYKGQYLKVEEKLIAGETYELAYLRPAVIIYARDNNGKLLFIREHRPHETPNVRLKPVTGFIDDGDDWLETAKRELREEANLIASKFDLIQHLPIKGSIITDKYFVLAQGLAPDPVPLKNPDGDVIEELLYFELDEAIKKTLSNEIPLTTDSLGLFILKERNL